MELFQDAENARQIHVVEKMIAPLRVVWPTAQDCTRALKEFATLHLAHGVGLLDALIAQTAIGHGALLVTFNRKHSQHISGLHIEQPYHK